MPKMNQTERERKAAWFRAAAGEDGYLTPKEIQRCIKEQNGIDVSYSDCIKMFKDLDADSDGKVTFDEFMGAMDGADMQRKKLISFFKKMDKNGDGKLTEDELMSGLSALEDVEVDKEQARAIIKAVDVDRDGKVDMYEFINAMCR